MIAGLAPGTFLRTIPGKRSDPLIVTVTPLAARAGVSGELALTGAWELASKHGWFGGFSALVANGDTGLIAGSDRGWLLHIDLAGPAPRPDPATFRFVGRAMGARKELVDLESLARDPVSGKLWAAFENFNMIERFAPDGTRALRQPREMRRWSDNSGPETMERLSDGRFVIIAEGAERGGKPVHEGLLFPGDPLGPAAPAIFRFVSWPDYDPVDAAQLPDGRVLILLRRVRYAIPARFDTAIAIADPREIRPDRPWRARIIERMQSGVFADNFEGIAFVPAAGDAARGSIWVISDDNFSVFQRSLLLRFDWSGTGIPAEGTP